MKKYGLDMFVGTMISFEVEAENEQAARKKALENYEEHVPDGNTIETTITFIGEEK